MSKPLIILGGLRMRSGATISGYWEDFLVIAFVTICGVLFNVTTIILVQPVGGYKPFLKPEKSPETEVMFTAYNGARLMTLHCPYHQASADLLNGLSSIK